MSTRVLNITKQDIEQQVRVTLTLELEHLGKIPYQKIDSLVQYILDNYDYSSMVTQELISLAHFMNIEGVGEYVKCENEFCEKWEKEEFLQPSGRIGMHGNEKMVCVGCYND